TEWEAEKARTRDASVAARRALRSAQREATRLRRSGTPEQREAAKQRVLELRQRAKEAKRAANRVRHNPPNWRDSIAGMGEAVPESRPPAARDHAQPETPDVPEQVATPHRRSDDKVPRGEGMFTPGSKGGLISGLAAGVGSMMSGAVGKAATAAAGATAVGLGAGAMREFAAKYKIPLSEAMKLPVVANDDDFKKVPVGAIYIHNGKPYRKDR
ncbi:MAG: hypothetical protein PHS96_15360, partial [Anaerolineales bacterium]|nr:hypothetical protein [Anaerolineales bacterium]